MFKIFRRPFALFFSCVTGVFIFMLFLSPIVHAAPVAATVTMSMPGGGPLVGHVGTPIQLSGQGFTAGSTIMLYLSSEGGADKCVAANVPNMLPFNTLPQVTATTLSNGAVGFLKNTKWPDNAANATSAYFLCAIASDAIAGMSDTAFTVAQQAKIDSVDPQTVAPGGTVTIKGSGWLPLQKLTVAVGPTADQAVAAKNVSSSGQDGLFTVQIALPASAQSGNYVITVYAVNEHTPAMSATGSLTVLAAPPTQAAATPTPTLAPTQTVGAVTPTPGSNGDTNSGGGSTSAANLLIFGLGGLGVVLVIVGITMLMIYSRRR